MLRFSNLKTYFQEPSSVEKIMEIDEHIGCAMSGLIADARTLVEHARVETQVYLFSLASLILVMWYRDGILTTNPIIFC